MTNEEMAVRIKNGETQLIESLWLNIEKLARSYSNRYYNKKREICIRSSVDQEDLYQVSYFAFLEAVRYYNTEKGYKFTTFLTLPLKKQFYKLTNQKVVSISLDDVTENGFSLNDTLLDEHAELDLENVLNQVYTSNLSNDIEYCFSEITPMQAQALKEYYFCDHSMSKIAQIQKTSKATVQMKISRGLANLRKVQNQAIIEKYKVA